MRISYSMPWGGVFVYTQDAIPRLGEYVSMTDKTYVVVEVRHFPDSNSAWIGLRSADAQ
jgi:hypothetical protein